MIENFETIVQNRPLNTNPVLRQQKVDFKSFQDDQGLYCLFLENYRVKEKQPFIIERVPENTDRSTSDKKNYYCVDVKQLPKQQVKNKIQINDDLQVMRGFIVQNPRQSVFFSATKSQGYLMLSKPNGGKGLQLRPFLCGSIIKKRNEEVLIDDNPNECKKIDDEISKVQKNKGKMPIEMYLQSTKAIKATRARKEESEFYEDMDEKVNKKENQKLKQKKRQQLEDYEDGETDNEDIYERENKQNEDYED